MRLSNPRRPTSAFTLVELLIVITIITILIMMFLPAWKGVKAGVDRMHCALNLSNCAKIILQYASKNSSWLPNFGSPLDLEEGIAEANNASTTQFPMVNELKMDGANAGIFTCPASPAWQDPTWTPGSGGTKPLPYFSFDGPPWASWDSTLNPPNGFFTDTGVKYVYTFGYCFFNRANANDPYNSNVGLRNMNWTHAQFHDKRVMPMLSSDPGELPLAADSIYSDGKNNWYGMYHEPRVHENDPNQIDEQMLTSYTSSSTDPNAVNAGACSYPALGGGHVVFLNGNCQWFDFGDIISGVTASPTQQEPMFVGPATWDPKQYYFGRMPASASSKLN